MLKGFWPQMADNPEASPTNREISRLENAIEKVVVSDTLTPADTAPWGQITRIVPRADAHERITGLKRGSAGTFWSSQAASSGTTCSARDW